MMPGEASRFSADWLALREPVDHAARGERLVGLLAQWLAGRVELQVVDLGAGTGSNLRWLGPRLDAGQRWLLVDHDTALLDRAGQAPVPAGSSGQSIRVDKRGLDLSGLPGELFEQVDLVTASALFDLVPVQWVHTLARRLVNAGAAGLFALTVDGRRWFTDAGGTPVVDERDAQLAELFNRHQQGAKGLGEALGPEAARTLPAALEAAGLRVRVERADWQLAAGGTRTVELGTLLLDDWALAATQQSPPDMDWIEAWRRRRLAALRSGDIGIGVGHVDVLALPQANG